MEPYLLKNDTLTVSYAPERFALSVTAFGAERHWVGTPRLLRADGSELSFAGTVCESAPWTDYLTEGVRAVYSGFRTEEGELPLRAVTTVGLELESGDLRCEIRLENEEAGAFSALFWPCPLSFDDHSGRGFSLLPQMQGTLIPARWPKDIHRVNQRYFTRCGTMPIYAQTANGLGCLTIIETPFDVSYDLEHKAGGDTEIALRFRPSLGRCGTRRAIRQRFRRDYSYAEMARDYRAYKEERGEVKTLREKITRNPAIGYLVGAAIVHEGIAVHVSPDSSYYDREHPENNDHYVTFDSLAERLRKLKAKGMDRVYLHTDGWGNHGYDNLHPYPFPPHEQAGGAAGMKRLADTCDELGYIFGIHDQYRDYYYESPVFTEQNAVRLFDGTMPFDSTWHGGKQTMLCANLALGFVRRVHKEFKRLGINVRAAYHDVFSIAELDECSHPDHPMTREQCARERMRTLEYLNARGIIPSSEEVVDCNIDVLPLVHHTTFWTENLSRPTDAVGVPVPFLNLCYHDCVVIPWAGAHSKAFGGWGIPQDQWGYLYGLQNAGAPYLSPEADEEELARVRIAQELQKRLAFERMTDHRYLDADYTRALSVYSDGTEIEIDLRANTYEIRYAK